MFVERARRAGKFLARHRGDAPRGITRVEVRNHPAVMPQAERDIGPRQRNALVYVLAMTKLGRLGAQEFAPRRRIEIQVADFNAGAARMRGGLHRALLPAFGAEAPCMLRSRGSGSERDAR